MSVAIRCGLDAFAGGTHYVCLHIEWAIQARAELVSARAATSPITFIATRRGGGRACQTLGTYGRIACADLREVLDPTIVIAS